MMNKYFIIRKKYLFLQLKIKDLMLHCNTQFLLMLLLRMSTSLMVIK
nr:MAG TPA: hypothetical protein [Bacteriophage sp.]